MKNLIHRNFNDKVLFKSHPFIRNMKKKSTIQQYFDVHFVNGWMKKYFLFHPPNSLNFQ